nr:EAL domain-containing protein [Paenibacillus bovis]
MDDKVNILLVDDRPENLIALEAIIEREDYQLMKATSGEEALKYLLKYDFAAILLDVQMPGMDGFRTAKIIKAREKTKHIPILFITANNMDSEHIFMGYSVGAIDYILKPIDPLILKAKVDGFVEIYMMKKQLIQQAQDLTRKTEKLEEINKELSIISSELRKSEALTSVISETSIDSMLVLDELGQILKINPAVNKMFQYDADSLIGKHISLLFSSLTSKQYMNKIIESHYVMGLDNITLVDAVRKDGTIFPVEIQIGRRLVQNEWIVAITLRDITVRKKNEELVTHLAYYDTITELPNKQLFHKEFSNRLEIAKNQNQTLAIMQLDVDRFKYVNDSLGYIIGDRVLKEIAKRLLESTRASDIVARLGSSAFSILLPNTDREAALDVAEQLIDAFKKPFIIDKYELFITTSIGLSIFPYDGDNSFVLMKNANAALYRAKDSGKNTFKVFHSGMNVHSYRSFMLQNDLPKALERSEFTLVYTPRLELNTGLVKSVEVLVHWNHPKWGTILPDEFIPLAEETGYIIEIGKWMLDTLGQQMVTWKQQNVPPIRVAINFTALQIIENDFVESLSQFLEKYEISSKLLEVILIDSIVLQNEPIIAKALKQLGELGVSITINNFGAGYLSLKYIRELAVNTLKLDKSLLLTAEGASYELQVLLSGVISMAHQLKMNVIADGVETEEQLKLLMKEHCDEIQGSKISQPVTGKQLDHLVLSEEKPQFLNIRSSLKEVTNKVDDFQIQKQQLIEGALERTKKLYSVSAREMDVFKLILEGLGNKEISEKLYISEHTVKNHITRIFQKLNVNDRMQAMAMVLQMYMDDKEEVSENL